MGSRTVSFHFTPGENEQIETVIKVPEERRSIIHGVVKNQSNKIIKDAVVKLYECNNQNGDHTLKPLSHTFTDEWGQFSFGPLWPCRHYVIKVWVNDVKIRELVIHSDKNCENRMNNQKNRRPVYSCDMNEKSQEDEQLSMQSIKKNLTGDNIDEMAVLDE